MLLHGDPAHWRCGTRVILAKVLGSGVGTKRGCCLPRQWLNVAAGASLLFSIDDDDEHGLKGTQGEEIINSR